MNINEYGDPVALKKWGEIPMGKLDEFASGIFTMPNALAVYDFLSSIYYEPFKFIVYRPIGSKEFLNCVSSFEDIFGGSTHEFRLKTTEELIDQGIAYVSGAIKPKFLKPTTVIKEVPMPADRKTINPPLSSAPYFLDQAAKHMRDRQATYDCESGERSMAQTVKVFNAFHGSSLTEAQGWHFMQILKDVRLFTRGTFHRDSAEDCVAYAALKAEAKAKE